MLLDNAWNGQRFTPASPYWDRSALFDERITRLVPDGEHADPDEVARLICDAALGERPGLRHLAGSDAHLLATAYRQTEFEGFEQAMRHALDWWD